MERRKVQRAFMQAQKYWEHVKARAEEIFSKSQFTAISRRRRRRVASKEGPYEAMAEFKNVGTPARTREEKQSKEHVKGSGV